MSENSYANQSSKQKLSSTDLSSRNQPDITKFAFDYYKYETI